MEFDKIYTKVNKRGGIKTTTTYIHYKGTIITLDDKNIHIENSYRIYKLNDIEDILFYLYTNYKCKVLDNRTVKNLTKEWIGHNNLYKLGLFKSHTSDVDLDYPQKTLHRIIWFLLSIIRL